MAVVNSPYVGISRGRLGEAVYYRAKGNTNLRQYNPSPQNRRTVSQQSQRSLFSSAVKFFSRGVQNLFVFAYEDKRTQESDYNAFMRYNAKNGIYFGPEQNSNIDYPALGNWVLTSGSLQRVNYAFTEEGCVFTFRGQTGGQEINTVSQLTQLLVQTGDWQEGDILTILHIGSDAGGGSPAQPVVLGSNPPVWVIKQLILNSASGQLLSEYMLEVSQSDFDVVVTTDVDFGLPILRIHAFAIIHSRNSGGQLKVSDSTLLYAGAGVSAIGYGRSDTWKQIVMAAWQAEQPSILQGGVAQRSISGVVPTVINGFVLPSDSFQLSGKQTFVSGVWLQSEIERHVRVVLDTGEVLTVGSRSEGQFSWRNSEGIVLYVHLSMGSDSTVLRYTATSEYVTATVQSIYWDAN